MRIRAFGAAIFAMLAMVFGFAAPAQAAVQGCPEATGYLCFYPNTGYGGGRWQISFSSAQNNCINLSGSSYTTGGTVANTQSSLVITPMPASGQNKWYIFDLPGCDAGAGNRAFSAASLGQSSDLSLLGWNNRISSIIMCDPTTIFC